MVGLDEFERGDEHPEEGVEVHDLVVVDTEVLHLLAEHSNVLGQLHQLIVVQLDLAHVLALDEEVLADVADLVAAEEGHVQRLRASEGQRLEEIVLQLEVG